MDSDSLLRSIPYTEHEEAKQFSCEICEELARLAGLRVSYQHLQRPGEQLIRDLDRRGLNTSQYRRLLQTFNSRASTQLVSECFRPQAKVAILIGNELYKHMSKLRTPEKDCRELGEKLRSLGFIVVILKDATADAVRRTLDSIVDVIPEKSYCLIYYAGHGFELSGGRCALGVDAPAEAIRPEHAVSASHLLGRVARCRPEMCVLLMDMCAFSLSRESNPALFTEVPGEDKYRIDGGVVIGYSTSSEEGAYEQIQMSFSTSGLIEDVVELNTADHARAVPKASLYGAALCRHIRKRLHISEILDLVSADLTCKGQTPVKVQSGPKNRYLYDKASGDQGKLMRDLRDVLSRSEATQNVIILDLAR